MNIPNSDECSAAAAKYGDILPLSRPEPSSRHPRMPAVSRAKIFSPFAALRGYEEEIEKENQKNMRTEQKSLSEDSAMFLSHQLSLLEKGMVITAVYFKKDATDSSEIPAGSYVQQTGTVTLIDSVFRQLKILCSETYISIDFDSLAALKIHHCPQKNLP